MSKESEAEKRRRFFDEVFRKMFREREPPDVGLIRVVLIFGRRVGFAAAPFKPNNGKQDNRAADEQIHGKRFQSQDHGKNGAEQGFKG